MIPTVTTLGLLALSATLSVGLAPPDDGPGGRRPAPPAAVDRGGPAESVTPDNILVILADDLGVDLVGAYAEGADLPPTPNVDGLAADGVLFRNAWSDPVCSPTRATILTGQYGFRTRVGFGVDFEALEPGVDALSRTELTIPEMLDAFTDGAYAHSAFGKWHLGTSGVGDLASPNEAGFSHYAGALSNFEPPEGYYDWTRVEDGVATPETSYATTVNVDDALAWIATAPEPWFCYLAFNAPHSPFEVPPAALHTVDVSSGTTRVVAKAMVEAMDTEIGRLLAGISATTTVIFLGDNGTSPGVVFPPFTPDKAKGTLFEGGINVPLIVRSPVVTVPGSESQALVNTTEFLFVR